MCVLEIVHFLPLALIAAFVPVSMFRKGVLAMALSVVGLMAGSHAHEVHAHLFTAIDPCLMHFATLIIATGVSLKSVASKAKSVC